ncbi:hypothetical protein [Amycolatopsis thermoflava]|uniref:hypothetical protein n=1 Tax=Amycolatopsis thermoflava TaxID=84480 RepID=UPI0036660A8B
MRSSALPENPPAAITTPSPARTSPECAPEIRAPVTAPEESRISSSALVKVHMRIPASSAAIIRVISALPLVRR